MIHLGKQLFRAFLNIKLAYKHILIIVCLILLPVSVATIYSQRQYHTYIQQKTKEYLLNISDETMYQLDQYISSVEKTSYTPLYFKDLIKSLEDPGKVQSIQDINFYIDLFDNLNSTNKKIYLFDNNKKLYSSSNPFRTQEQVDAKYDKWRSIAENANGGIVFLGTEQTRDYFNKTHYVMTTVQILRDPNTLSKLGLVAIDTNMTKTNDIFAKMNELTQGSTMIINNQDRIIYNSDSADFPAIPTQDIYNQMTKNKGSFFSTLHHKNYLVVYDTSEKTGWKIIVISSVNALFGGMIKTRNTTLMVNGLIIMFALVIAVTLVVVVIRPLKDMIGLMKQVQNGNFNVQYPVKSTDEVGLLGTHFNQMIQRTQKLFHRVYEVELNKKKAELEMLQSQINPHFLYNTLETIRMVAEINQDVQASEMTYVLGNLLRYGINRDDSMATLRQELNHIDNYLYLQNYRYDDNIHLHAHIPNELLQQRVIKLLLQPILENSILHGMSEDKEALHVSILGFMEEGAIILKVRDDGEGMSAERLQDIQQQFMKPSVLDRKKPSPTGIGLNNVNERIQLQYGTDYGLSLESVQGQGTVVTICIPMENAAVIPAVENTIDSHAG